ncbi:CAAX protease self-immunity [Aliicoccus persicus]|uniref:CAAX protease self-immunity n=2 Tax=Aliicoccus persicus TaxID=930138 RepID=A0A662Z5R5_9STAP|nr:CAAX protease self-immunity [Aliicoccus persicus]
MTNKQLIKKRYNWLIYCGLILILIAAAWIMIQNNGMIEFSADHDITVPFWHNWVIYGALLLLILFLPGSSSGNNPLSNKNRKVLVRQSTILTTLALLLFIGLLLVPKADVFSYFPLFKIVLLLIAPIVMFFIYRQKRLKTERLLNHSYLKDNQWLYPSIITIMWIALYYFSPFSSPEVPGYEIEWNVLFIGALVSFLINSVLEEVFYRVWLQTRLEVLLGTWPAIMVTSILWAVWHMAIQGGESADIAFSNVIVNQGVTGLFLGFLWAKYRNVWVLIIIHGLMNFPLEVITELF